MAALLVPEHEIVEQVLNAMAEAGVSPHDGDTRLVVDGMVHRYRVQGDPAGKENGYYRLYPDEWPAGYFGTWKHSAEPVKWRYSMKGKTGTDEYRKACAWVRSADYKDVQAYRERERQEEQAKATEAARACWEKCGSAPEDHPYLKRKLANSYGLRVSGESLVVPLYGGRKFRTFQLIKPDGEKMFYPGVSTKGVYFPIAVDLKKGPVLICEGYATGATLHECTGHTVICAMNAGNLPLVTATVKEAWPDRPIVICADNDAQTKGNPGIAKATEAANQCQVNAVIYPTFDEPGRDGNPVKGTDWNDYALAYGLEAAENVLRARVTQALATPMVPPQEAKRIEEAAVKVKGRVAHINGADLLKMEFPDVKWAVDGFLPEGLSILCGGPKVGKSILALHLALAVATGGVALGKIPVERGAVLYLALEDTRRRLKSRIVEAGIDEQDDLSKLTLVTEIPRQHEGGIDWVESWLMANPDARFVIVDTLQKYRKPHADKGDRYASDYDAIAAIKSVADRHNVAALIIHHTKKAKDEDDWLNEVSGTQGLAGAADTLIFLKRGRCQNIGNLRMTGRDIEETELAMTLADMGWRLEGLASDFDRTTEERAVIAHLKEAGMQTPKEVAEALGLSGAAARMRLKRMSDRRLICTYGGKYWVEAETSAPRDFTSPINAKEE